jgi:aminopeptidase N
VLDKWFTLQATAPTADALAGVQRLVAHPDFTLKNPNRVRAVIGAFAGANPAGFHRPDGAAYAFLADQVLALDRLNPQVAARLVQPLTRWRRLVAPYQAEMRVQLERVLRAGRLSNDLYEVVSKGLAE